MLSLTSLPPLSLYIHIPWCVKKCPYCDFNSHGIEHQTLPEKDYVDALIEDLTQQIPNVWGRKLTSIFIGGGTPSLFSTESFEYLISQIRALIPFAFDIEITMEANPGTAEASKFKGFFQAGINRLSIGGQSFNNEHLAKLGRIHSSDEIKRAVQFAHDAQFERVNIDLMHGLPGQTINEALSDLDTAISLGISHLSWYQLTLEPNTLFYQKPPKLPEDDALADIQESGEKTLIKAGFNQYEVSAFSKSQTDRSRHNLNYWSFGDYLAIGAGAHGKLTMPAENKILRYSQFRNPKDYLNKDKPFTQNKKVIASNDLPLEFMMNVLRLKQEIPLSLFTERTGLSIHSIDNSMEKAREKNLIEVTNGYIKTTELGHQFLNELLEIFMSENTNIPEKINIKKVD
ncbi:radical SAM family heme chaperone HemW [Pleionea sediminis]|uniref:radical SAM family heme chaperone HemW n=1 Tax=Pleionea sediminis TaxID=2569479 RepID=UPI0011852509|nr:radical SAM family heme chaperone HemW [Pleionea sediminis]